tara:strand:+ start:649 stop:3372 length:2724 start_codon:yes stop_codon:yes gene_type:complete
MATGIDQLGGSLLAQKESAYRQNRRDVKKAARTEQKMAIFNGILKFADGAIQDKHKKFFETEHSRTVARLLKNQQKMLDQRAQYEEKLNTSNKTKEAHELDLIEDELNDNEIGNYIDGWVDFTPIEKRQIKYGSGATYDPKTNNRKESGLYGVLVHNRLAARDAWANRLKDLDPYTATQEWKEVNPYSKNLLSGALNVLKRTFSGSAKTNTEAAKSALLDGIKSDTDKYESFKEARAAGFSIERAIKEVNESITLPAEQRRGKQFGEIKYDTDEVTNKVPFVFSVEDQILAAMRDNNLTREQAELQKYNPIQGVRDETVKTHYRIVNYKNSSGDITSIRSVLTEEDRKAKNPSTGKYFTTSEIKTSQANPVESVITLPEVPIIDYVTGGEITSEVKVVVDANGKPIRSYATPVNQLEYEIAQNPTAADVNPELITSTITEVNFQFSKLAKLEIQNIDALPDYITTFAAFTPESNAEKYKIATENFAVNTILVADKIESITKDVFKLNRSDTNLVAMQTILIDKYAEQTQLGLVGRVNLNGQSGGTDNVDTTKVLLAIDLLRAKGALSRDSEGAMITSKNLERKINDSQLLDGEEGFAGNPLIDNEHFFDSGEIETLRGIKKFIDNLDEKNTNKTSLLDMILTDEDPTSSFFKTKDTAFNFMIGGADLNVYTPERPSWRQADQNKPKDITVDTDTREKQNLYVDDPEEQFPRKLNVKMPSPEQDSLLSNPKTTELKLPDIESTVEDKIEFFAEILGDQPNEVEFMKEVVWQESKNGTAAGTYELNSKGEGSYGVAQVDRSGFDQIQGKLTDPESKYFKVAETLKEATGLDLSTVKYEDLNDDLLSVIYGRLYLAQITNEPIPDTVEGRAEYWKKYYNTSAGKGTVKGYLINMEERNSKVPSLLSKGSE